MSASYTDPTDAGSLPEELDPFPELQLGNPQGVPTGDESAQAQQHHQQAPQPPPPAAPLPEDVQPDSLRYTVTIVSSFDRIDPIASNDKSNVRIRLFIRRNRIVHDVARCCSILIHDSRIVV